MFKEKMPILHDEKQIKKLKTHLIFRVKAVEP